ncbi:hypothetical protein LEMLEM_LOCUS21136 [Lemmus lemmus]
MVNGLRSGLAGESTDGRLSGCLRCPLQDWTPCGPQRHWSCHASWTALGPAGPRKGLETKKEGKAQSLLAPDGSSKLQHSRQPTDQHKVGDSRQPKGVLGSSSKDRGRSSLLSAPLGRQGRDGLVRKARARGACGTEPGALTWLGGRGRAGERAGRRSGSEPGCGRPAGRSGRGRGWRCGYTAGPEPEASAPPRSKVGSTSSFQPPAETEKERAAGLHLSHPETPQRHCKQGVGRRTILVRRGPGGG